MWERFSQQGRKAVFLAQAEAQGVGRRIIDPIDLLVGILADRTNDACLSVLKLGLDVDGLWKKAIEVSRNGANDISEPPTEEFVLSMASKQVIDRAFMEARNATSDFVGTKHLLLALLKGAQKPKPRIRLVRQRPPDVPPNLASDLLAANGIEYQKFKDIAMSTVTEVRSPPAAPVGLQSLSDTVLLRIRQGACTSEVVVAASVAEQQSKACELLRKVRRSPAMLRFIMDFLKLRDYPDEVSSVDQLLVRACAVAEELGQPLSSAHLLVAAVEDESNPSVKALVALDSDKLKDALRET